MEIPIQVAVQIYPGFPNEARCVETIPQPFIDTNANNLTIAPITATSPPIGGSAGVGIGNAGLVQVNGNREPNSGLHQTYSIQHALPYDCTKEFVYRKTVYPLIAMFLEGYDASIVTYGQHGTGKTHTMYGPGFDCVFGESDQGIVQRSVRDIFAQLVKRQRQCRFVVNVAWIEICGNEIQDILGGRIVRTIGDVFQCLKIGMANRSQEASHSLFTITLEQQWVTADGLIQHRLSTASFCDLCGTERIITDDINNFDQQICVPKDLGLQALERIVGTLCDPNFCMLDNMNANLMHQYEETTLTRLLKDSFGGRAQTLMILCVSPLEQDVIETIQNLEFAYKVQFVRNMVMLNTFSDNNLPVANFIGAPPPVMTPQVQPSLLPSMQQQMPVHPMMSAALEKFNVNQQAVAATFGLKFAATQWLKLVSNAEGLFSKLLTSDTGKQLNEQDRECIEEWMFLKQECEECLSSGELVSNPRLLGPIPETDEADETTDEVVDAKKVIDSSILTDNESDSEDVIQQTEYLEEKMGELMVNFSNKVNALIDEKDREFIDTYPKAITNSFDNNANNVSATSQPCPKTKRSSSVALPSTGSSANRRRSIQPGGSNSDALQLSSADLEHLQKVANESMRQSPSSLNNSICREAADFLENSNEMHPLRKANVNKVQESLQNDIRSITTNIVARDKQIVELQQTIALKEVMIKDLIKEMPIREQARRKMHKKVTKLQKERGECERQLQQLRSVMANPRYEKEIASLNTQRGKLEKQMCESVTIKQIAVDRDSKLMEYKKSVRESRKLLNDLDKMQKKDRRLRETLEEQLRQEKSKVTIFDDRITQLDYVLQEKNRTLKMNSGEDGKEQTIRHEIRNLRSERDRLVDTRCLLNRKLKEENALSGNEVREILKCDVAIELIDSAIEYKNELICGRHVSSNKKTMIHRHGSQHQQSNRPNGDIQLMTQLNRLNEKEMRTLLYKCLQKIIDLRESSRQLEIQLLQFEHERNEWKLRECTLYNAIQQSRLEGERDALNLQRQQEATFAMLLQMAAEDSASISHNSSMLMSPHRTNLMQLIEATSQQHHRRQYIDNGIDAGTMTSTSNRLLAQQLMAVTNTTTTTVATAASSTHCRTELDSHTGEKSGKNNRSLFKMFRNTPSTYGGQSSAISALPEPHKVTRDKNKLIIQRNK